MSLLCGSTLCKFVQIVYFCEIVDNLSDSPLWHDDGRLTACCLNLSFAIAKQPYLEADRPIGKSLSRGKGFRDRVAWIKIMT